MTIDFQGLLNVVKAAEKETNFNMSSWTHPNSCGTSHCMIGAFCSQNPEDKLYLDPSNHCPVLAGSSTCRSNTDIAIRFGITPYEAQWLFTASFTEFAYKWTSAMNLSKERAIARLRKFIYYKLHKQELIIEKGRNGQLIDLGRNIGHVNFVNKSLESCTK